MGVSFLAGPAPNQQRNNKTNGGVFFADPPNKKIIIIKNNKQKQMVFMCSVSWRSKSATGVAWGFARNRRAEEAVRDNMPIGFCPSSSTVATDELAVPLNRGHIIIAWRPDGVWVCLRIGDPPFCLVARSCHSRKWVASEKDTPLVLLAQIVWPRPTIMRASFFDLLMALWVDRHPHYQARLKSNQLSDAWENGWGRILILLSTFAMEPTRGSLLNVSKGEPFCQVL